MSCACKDTAMKAGKLSEDKSVFEEVKGWKKIFYAIEKVIITVISFIIVVAISPITLFVVIFRSFIGKESRIKASSIVKLFKKKS